VWSKHHATNHSDAPGSECNPTPRSVFNGKNIDGLYKKVADDDLTTNNLLGGLVGTSAWGVVLVALFSIFSLIVLLRKTIALTGAGFSYGVIVGKASWSLEDPFHSAACAQRNVK
jgi:hypothetical protein